MFWYIFIALILITLLWILFGPVIIFLNTESKRYSLSLPGIFRAKVVPTAELFMIRGSVFFIPYRFDPFHRKPKKKKEKPEKPPRKKRSFKLSNGMSMGKNIMHSFRIRKLHLDIDTDDYALNAWLIPAFSALNSENISLQANFEGNASLLLDLRTRLGALLWAFLKTKYNSMLNQ
ncbi:MAG: hypothetical protein GY790_05125 [Bacteroidetes bacterium]|nr:hypothetical protein [Bacteroidota bacterium]